MSSQDEEQSQIEAKNDRKIKTGTDLHKVNDKNRSTGLWTHHVLKLKHVWYTHTCICYISLYTGKCISWVCVLGWLTVTQEVWPTWSFLELVMPDHMVKVTTIVLSDTHITSCKMLPMLFKTFVCWFACQWSVGIANSFGFISWNIAYTSSNIFLNSIILVVISDCLWKAGNGPKSCTGCQAGTANSCNFRVELRTHVVLCVLLLFGYGIARAFPWF